MRRHGSEMRVQVDGGVSASTIEQCAEAGADVFVAGSAVYGAESAAGAIDELRALAARHAHRIGGPASLLERLADCGGYAADLTVTEGLRTW